MNSHFSQPQPLTLTLGHLYPDQLNLYGDRGNILTLQRRCALRNITYMSWDWASAMPWHPMNMICYS